MVNIVTNIISASYKAGAISREQKDIFAISLLEISKSAKWAIEQQGSGNTTTSDQIATIYAYLTEKILDALIALMQDFGKLADEDEDAKRLLQEFMGALLSVFTWAVFNPVSEGPASAGNQLETGTTKLLN